MIFIYYYVMYICLDSLKGHSHIREARRGELCLAYGERGEAMPRACVYDVASTSGATAI